MLLAMNNCQADMVPVAPDMSNMIPCKLTGRPFWDIYLHKDPPLWQAYIHAAKFFGIDGWQPDLPLELDHERKARLAGPQWIEAIVARTPERIYTRTHASIDGKEVWSDRVTVYYKWDPPTSNVPPEKVGLSLELPTDWENIEPRKGPQGVELLPRMTRLQQPTN